MNNKAYRLLRNNKEQGSFTSQELIQKGLKPFDLIWIDGRSTSWSYPSEIPEFKMYFQGEEPVVKPITNKQDSRAQISSAALAAVTMNDNLVQAETAKQKPRYKVSAAWSKIQTVTVVPALNNVMVAEPKKTAPTKIVELNKPQTFNAKSLSWEQAWLDWEHEKHVVPVKTETAIMPSVASKKSINDVARTAPVLEKKFEQSLDTITDKYIDNILQQKKKSKGFSLGRSSEFVLPSIALIVIFSIGYWLLNNNKTASAVSVAPVNHQQIASTNADEKKAASLNSVSSEQAQTTSSLPVQNTDVDAGISDEPVATSTAKEKAPEHIAKNTKYISPVKTNVPSNIAANKIIQPNSTNVSNIDLNKAGKPVNKQFDASVINNIPNNKAYNDAASNNNGDLNAAENRPVRRRTNDADVPANQPSNNNVASTKNTKTKSGLNYVSVPEYVTMDNGNGSLKIQNTSDVDLDLVVVDVQYFDASSRYRKGETLYLHNLKAGKSVTVKTPRDLNSSYATSKVSLVSSDANGIYAVGDK